MQNKEFKLGDRVKYVSNVFLDEDSNPLWGGLCGKVEGVIDHLSTFGLPVEVMWDNGMYNSYNYSDLELINKQTQLNLFRE
uniref:Uncharacterized protein n=1 Tax=viral metagenome TaxID=1070528 RepID=A0A6H1ZQZ6_9ZZZZ